MREKEFKQTEIGRIPKEWEVVTLVDICTKITDGTHKTPKYQGTGVPFLSTQNLVPFRKGFDFSQYKKYISLDEHKELIKRCKPEKGDILISKCGTIGRTKLIDVDYEFSIFVGLALLKLRKGRVEPRYLEQLLNFQPYVRQMEVTSPGATRKTLTIAAIEKLTLPLPPLPEQKKIAKILSTVDQAIEKVDESIAKTERLKKGLMQELLTKGIRHKEFKNTEIGRIPKGWEVVRIKESKEIDLIMGQSPPGKSYNKKREGVPFLQGKAEFGNKYPSPILWTTQPTKVADEGDILISVRAPVGDVNICPYRLCIGRGLAAIRIKESSNIFYFYWFQKEKQRIENIGKGSTFKAITKNELSNIFIPFPPLPEQQKIAEILSTVDKRLELLRNKKERLGRIKKGLMNDLLTGKRRVRVDKS